jgi:hypothetical protein
VQCYEGRLENRSNKKLHRNSVVPLAYYFMSSIYTRKLNVFPFFLIPDGTTKEESSVILSPEFLTRKSKSHPRKSLPDIFYKQVENQLYCPIISQLIPGDSGAFIVTTFQTKILNARTGRSGLKFTYGAFVRKETFAHKSNICTKIFDILDNYICVDGLTILEATNKIVDEFQVSVNPFDTYFNPEKVENLLNSFESKFCISDRKSLSFVSKVIIEINQSKVLKHKWIKPSIELEEVKEFWRHIDKELSFDKQHF